MCGLNAIINMEGAADADLTAIHEMNESIVHRGPDHTGVHAGIFAGGTAVTLGHTRLSIFDTSPISNQPMVSHCGRYALVFNGEIYNYPEMRSSARFKNVLSLRSENDTATLFDMLVSEGPSCLSAFNGMWAFVFVDYEKQAVVVGRDRCGKKPLHYFIDAGHRILFSSEAKGIRKALKIQPGFNKEAISNFLFRSLTDYDCTTFFNGILQVPPGTYATINFNVNRNADISFVSFWEHPYQVDAQCSTGDDFSGSAARLRDLLIDSVSLRMRSDVPVGILLSGGLDSTAVLTSACQGSRRHVVCFSAVSDDPEMDESKFIHLAAKSFDCELHTVNVSRDPAYYFGALTHASHINDQPLPSLSFVVHKELVATAKQQGIRVLLSGQGSDEQLCGYNKFLYFHIAHQWKSGNYRKAIRSAREFYANKTVFRDFKLANAIRYIPFLRGRGQQKAAGPALAGVAPIGSFTPSCLREAECNDMRKYSLPMLLHTEDRMSMLSGVEIRVPFLDVRVVEFLAGIPVDFKLRNGWTKAILREAFKGLAPDEIMFRRDKRGFGIPQNFWLRNQLKPQIRQLICGGLLTEDAGFIAKGATSILYDGFLKGTNTHSRLLFNIISLETWMRHLA